jgi:hypothetical protein
MEGQVGQFYPARLAGGDYVLETGIFGAPVHVVPGDVELLASYSNGRLTILWDRAAAGFELETSGSLGTGAQWSAVNTPRDANATHFFISVPVSAQHQFFRLRRP